MGIVAVQGRVLTRDQLRAVARALAGKAKTPNVDIYASDATYEACGRYRFALLRQNVDPADAKACNEGTLLWMSESEPRVVYWGFGAPGPQIPAAKAEHAAAGTAMPDRAAPRG